MDFTIREMKQTDRDTWSAMRAALWPDETSQAHAEWIARILGRDDTWGFIAHASDGAGVGFAEVAIRPYANGCESAPVPFLEGIFVRPEFRRHGAGAKLIAHIEGFLGAKGFRELGSDSEIDNDRSHLAHARWGFRETERVVYFRKLLGDD